jgi:hypothetical protein
VIVPFVHVLSERREAGSSEFALVDRRAERLRRLAILVFDQWRKSTTFFEPTEVLSTVSWSLLAYGVWIGGWALLNRLLRHRTRLVAHASVAFVASSVYTLGQWGFEWLRFLLAPIEPLQLADLAVTTLIWSLALLGHLTVMGVAQGGRRLGVVGVGFCAILGLQLLDHYNESIDWVTTLPYWSRLEPVDPALLPVESVDDFFAAIPELRDELEVLVLEAQEEEEAEEPDVEDESLGVEPPVEPAAQRLRDRPGARV